MRANAISSLVIFDRAIGKVRYLSTGWPASQPDIAILKNSSLFAGCNAAQKQQIFEEIGPIVTDQGYRDQTFPKLITPICSRMTIPGRRLYDALLPVERRWTKRISAIEARIENLFSQIFYNEFFLLKRKPRENSTNGRSTVAKMIMAATIVHNMQIDDLGGSFMTN